MDAERKRIWSDRAWSLGQAVVLVLVGASVSQGFEFWRTFGYISSDIRGHILSSSIFNDHIDIRLALVNKGNRQGAVTGLHVVFPIRFDQITTSGKSYVSQRSSDFSVTGIPVALNPGDIRLVSLKGGVDRETVDSYAKPVDPKADDADASKPDLRKQDLALRLRSIDFRGRKYETSWPVGSLYISGKQIESYRIPASQNGTELKLFDERGFSPGSWFPEDDAFLKNKFSVPDPLQR